MEITLTRKENAGEASTGQWFIDGVFECYSLEDKDRGLDSAMSLARIKMIKVWGKTAIPVGRYQVVKSWWTKHGRYTPMLIGVPGFEGIRIHSGVTSNDTEGCPLLCSKIINDVGQNSKAARIAFDTTVLGAIDRGEQVWLTVTREYECLPIAA